MAIAFGAIGTKFTQTVGATPTAIAYPATVGAGDLLVAARASWNTVGASLTAESGWTACAQLFGGNAGGAVDNHRTTVGADVKEAAGGETGTVSFDIAGTVDGAAGVMARYTKGATETWGTVQSVTGDDATHGVDRSITASSTLDLIPGDMVVVSVATGTDTSLTITSPAITAAGITFGTTNRRTSGAGSTAGQDGNVELFDALVTSGSGTVTPALAFTTATSQSGPATFVRLRVNFTGTASIAATGTITAAGQVGTSSDASIAATGTITAAGSVTGGAFTGTASIAATDTVTAAGNVGTSSGSSLSATDSITTAGQVGKATGASLAATDSITTTGSVGTSSGASISATGTISATGQIGVSSGASISATGAITTTGSVSAGGGALSSGATLAATDAITTTGSIGTSTGASIAATDSITTGGQVGKATGASISATDAITTTGQIGTTTGSGISATGTVTTTGQVGKGTGASLSATVTITATGRVGRSAGVSIGATVSITAAGSVSGSSPAPSITNPRARITSTGGGARITGLAMRALFTNEWRSIITANHAHAIIEGD